MLGIPGVAADGVPCSQRPAGRSRAQLWRWPRRSAGRRSRWPVQPHRINRVTLWRPPKGLQQRRSMPACGRSTTLSCHHLGDARNRQPLHALIPTLAVSGGGEQRAQRIGLPQARSDEASPASMAWSIRLSASPGGDYAGSTCAWAGLSAGNSCVQRTQPLAGGRFSRPRRCDAAPQASDYAQTPACALKRAAGCRCLGGSGSKASRFLQEIAGAQVGDAGCINDLARRRRPWNCAATALHSAARRCWWDAPSGC